MNRSRQVIRKKEKSKPEEVNPLEKQKLLWTIGHVATVILGTAFSVTYFYHVLFFYKYRQWKWLFLRVNRSYAYANGNSWTSTFIGYIPQILYRTSLMGFLLAGYISESQLWSGTSPKWYDLLCSEGFQSISMAAVWLLGGRKSFYRLFPFMVISYLHLINRKYEFQGDKKATEAATLKNAMLLQLIAYFEFFIAFVLLADTLLLKDGTSGFSTIFYIGLLWLRLNFSQYTQITALKLLKRIDKHVPAKHKRLLEVAENFMFYKMKENEKRQQLSSE